MNAANPDIMDLSRKSTLLSDAARFIVAGVVNTALTLVVYQALLLVMTPSLAYAGSWVAGLIYVAVVYPDKVFKNGRRGLNDRLALAGSYIAMFLLGLLLLQLLQAAGITPSLAIFAVVGTTTVMNFLLSRTILRRRTNNKS